MATQVEDTLALVQLSGFGNRLPSQLSGGQQQRVAIARAIVFRPPALLMDEPLGALDRRLREDMQVEIKRLHRQLGMTILYVTHDQEEALSLADRVAVMRAGRIEQIGTPRELYDSPANEFVADFLGQMNFLEGTIIATRTIRLDIGTVIETATNLPPTAQRVRIGIRPEAVRLDANGTIRGRIVAESYAGGSQIVHVELQQSTLRARVSVERGVTPCQVGDTIAVSWSPSDIHIFASPENADAPRPL
jgi:ABC-type Fe3+/spermidine/putrescine transport system ATPase subunit